MAVAPALGVEEADGIGGVGFYVSDTNSKGHQGGQISDGVLVPISSSAVVDGGTFYLGGNFTTDRMLDGSVLSFTSGNCFFNATTLEDNTPPNVAATVGGKMKAQPAP